MKDGTLYACGDNSDGQLGVGDYNDRYVLTQVLVPNPVKAVCQYSYSESLFIDIYDNVWGAGVFGLNPPGWVVDHTPNLIDFDFVSGS